MQIIESLGWQDYALIDSGNGKRLERFGNYVVSRPDPQAVWKPSLDENTWGRADAVFEQKWIYKTRIPQRWEMAWKYLKFWGRLTPFKHVGVFGEQCENWQWVENTIQNSNVKAQNQSLNVLNLFGYTGIASLVCAANGASVTHVDGSKPTIAWARENAELSGLIDKPIRWICDDAIKFCKREVRRGSKYEGLIIDLPAFGHGPEGEVWDFGKSFPELLEIVKKLISSEPKFVLLNSYAVSASGVMLGNCLNDIVGHGVEYGELVLVGAGKRKLSTGIYARWSQ